MAELQCPNWMSKLLSLLSSILERVSESNDVNPKLHPQKISVFHGLSKPNISILTYLERIFKYANCSPSCYIVAYVYLDRFAQRQPLLPITSFNVHRLLITSVMVAAKFMDDMYYNNAYYGKVGGISTAEMNFLELDFLFGLSFNLNVTPTTFHTYCAYLQREMLIVQPFSPTAPVSLDLQDFDDEYGATTGRSKKIPVICYNGDDQSHQNQQHQQQQLAV